MTMGFTAAGVGIAGVGLSVWGAERAGRRQDRQAALEAQRLEARRLRGEQLGQRELDFAEEDYVRNDALGSRVSADQTSMSADARAMSESARKQGDSYYDEDQNTYRPLRDEMVREARVDRSGEINAFDAANRADADTLTSDDSAIYNQRRDEIDADTGRAVADSQGGYTRALNQNIRAGLRYGGSGASIGAQTDEMAVEQASNFASAANRGRSEGISRVRGRVGLGMQLRGSNRTALNNERQIGWARKLDAAGLGKNLASQSLASYNSANTSLDTASRLSAGSLVSGMAAGSQKQKAMSQGNTTILGGYGGAAPNLGNDPYASLAGSIGANLTGAALTYGANRLP